MCFDAFPSVRAFVTTMGALKLMEENLTKMAITYHYGFITSNDMAE